MNRVLKRRLWLSAGAVVIGAVIGLAIGQSRAVRLQEKRAELAERMRASPSKVSIIVLPAGKGHPLGAHAAVLKTAPEGRLLAAPQGLAKVAVFEPSGEGSSEDAIRTMMKWVDGYPELETIYVTRPKGEAAAK